MKMNVFLQQANQRILLQRRVYYYLTIVVFILFFSYLMGSFIFDKYLNKKQKTWYYDYSQISFTSYSLPDKADFFCDLKINLAYADKFFTKRLDNQKHQIKNVISQVIASFDYHQINTPNKRIINLIPILKRKINEQFNEINMISDIYFTHFIMHLLPDNQDLPTQRQYLDLGYFNFHFIDQIYRVQVYGIFYSESLIFDNYLNNEVDLLKKRVQDYLDLLKSKNQIEIFAIDDLKQFIIKNLQQEINAFFKVLNKKIQKKFPSYIHSKKQAKIIFGVFYSKDE